MFSTTVWNIVKRKKKKKKTEKGNECVQQWSSNAWVDYIRGSVGPETRQPATHIPYYSSSTTDWSFILYLLLLTLLHPSPPSFFFAYSVCNFISGPFLVHVRWGWWAPRLGRAPSAFNLKRSTPNRFKRLRAHYDVDKDPQRKERKSIVEILPIRIYM